MAGYSKREPRSDQGISEAGPGGTDNGNLAPELRPDYYLVNFRQLLQFVVATYSSILSAEELSFSSDFNSLTTNAQRLYVRLLCRKKSVFRAGKLSYPEIDNLSEAALCLQDSGLLTINQNPGLDSLLPLFTRSELVSTLKLKIQSQIRRPAVEEYIRLHLDAADVNRSLLTAETLYTVLREDMFNTYRLCFFGNLYQDMTDFVLRDLGLTKFENYLIDRNTRVFHDRDQMQAHRQYYYCAELLESALSESSDALLDVHAQLPETKSYDTTLKRRVDRMTNNIARQLEREGDYESALSLYRLNVRPPSRERQARILATIGKPGDALNHCREIRQRPWNEEESVFALQFGARLAKKTGADWSRTQRHLPPEEHLELVQTGAGVEQDAAQYYQQRGACFYTENTLFNSVFGLVFWDIVFAPVPGVFFNPFQSAPADFYDPDFYQQRGDLIAQRFAELTSIDALTRIANPVFEEKNGIQNPLVDWRYLSEDLLQMAFDRIPLKDWVAIFNRLLADLRHHRTGFTDLVFFPESDGYVLIEVKGPGDTLQKNQQRWMQFFEEHSIRHLVAHVTWTGSDVDDRTQQGSTDHEQ